MCENPIYLKSKNMLVGCGRCPECRKKRSREIFFRLACEMSTSPCLFITLTFNDEHFADNNLNVRDLQLFFKRLRKNLKRPIKYYAVGEYGDNFGRKHYHAIIFNITYSDDKIINKCWPFGFVDIAPVESGSMAYVAGYVDKKLYGEDKDDFINAGITPPFSVCSRKLGFDFVKKNWVQICRDKMIKVGNHFYPVPRYFRLLLGLTFDNADYKEFITDKHEEISDNMFNRNLQYIKQIAPDISRRVESLEYEFNTSDFDDFNTLYQDFVNSLVVGKVRCDRKRLQLSRKKRDFYK